MLRVRSIWPGFKGVWFPALTVRLGTTYNIPQMAYLVLSKFGAIKQFCVFREIENDSDKDFSMSLG